MFKVLILILCNSALWSFVVIRLGSLFTDRGGDGSLSASMMKETDVVILKVELTEIPSISP